MSDKEIYEVLTKGGEGIYRYLMEYKLFPHEFNDEDDYNAFMAELKLYFRNRTGIREEILEISPSNFISFYPFKEVEE